MRATASFDARAEHRDRLEPQRSTLYRSGLEVDRRSAQTHARAGTTTRADAAGVRPHPEPGRERREEAMASRPARCSMLSAACLALVACAPGGDGDSGAASADPVAQVTVAMSLAASQWDAVATVNEVADHMYFSLGYDRLPRSTPTVQSWPSSRPGTRSRRTDPHCAWRSARARPSTTAARSTRQQWWPTLNGPAPQADPWRRRSWPKWPASAPTGTR